jgi:catechol 2,3-dioxygenase-like lactoylglutathione lyase family enzyme
VSDARERVNDGTMRGMFDFTRRQLLLSLPAMALLPRQLAATPFGLGQAKAGAAPIRVRTLNHFAIAVTDPKRSVDFYQGLFGMPIAARNGPSTMLRVGAGPQFISIGPVAAGATPSITHYCLGVDNFNVDRLLAELASHGVRKGERTAPLTVAVSVRGATGGSSGTPDLLFGDPDGIVCQLQDVSYCGGSGPIGNVCSAPEAAPKPGVLALRDINHLTIYSGDATRANTFYQDLFGLSVRAYQGPTAPTLAVGPTVQFLMFTGGGAPSTPPRPASINHACMTVDGFKPDAVLKALESYGLKPRDSVPGPAGPMRHYVTMRMENRGGAPGGTPELYFTDPDGLLMQLQDSSYCGGGGLLGEVCK